MNSYINVYKKKQWTFWILAGSWFFFLVWTCICSLAISLCTYTMIWSEQALCLKSSYNMWILLWLYKFMVYMILQCVMFVWLYNNPCATCISEINIYFIIKMCYNRYKKCYKPCVPLFHIVLYHNVEVLLELKKVLQQTIPITLGKCSDR